MVIGEPVLLPSVNAMTGEGIGQMNLARLDTSHWCRYSVWDSVHDGFLLAWFPGLSS